MKLKISPIEILWKSISYRLLIFGHAHIIHDSINFVVKNKKQLEWIKQVIKEIPIKELTYEDLLIN